LVRTLTTYSIGYAHSAAPQAICQHGKISFEMDRVKYLGYIVDEHGEHADLANI
jgi:hypothetical protein